MPHSRAYHVFAISIVFLMAFPAWADQKNLFTWFRGGESTVIGPGRDSPVEYYPFGFDDDQCSTLPQPLAEFVSPSSGRVTLVSIYPAKIFSSATVSCRQINTALD